MAGLDWSYAETGEYSLEDELMVEITKPDWKLFREKLPGWQEAYMERLCKEYTELLNSDKKASEKFWELDKRIKSDRKRPGVIVSISRSQMIYQLAELMQDGAITPVDLDEFSEDVKIMVDRMSGIWQTTWEDE